MGCLCTKKMYVFSRTPYKQPIPFLPPLSHLTAIAIRLWYFGGGGESNQDHLRKVLFSDFSRQFDHSMATMDFLCKCNPQDLLILETKK